MGKFCVFCGTKPEGKNNEHIIPKWLIELTGNPNRVVEFGPVWNPKTLSLEPKEFAFDQFQFPSCESCNQKFSGLEIKAKNVIEHLIKENALSREEINVLLDWLDKIRTGLWLGYNYLQKNIAEIEPNYFITNRIGKSDRSVFIYKSDSVESGINFAGASVPAFQYNPVCFNLRINQYCLFNIATDFAISKHLGLPYSSKSYFTEGREIRFVLQRGKNRVSYPLIRKPYDKKCAEIYQPIFSRFNSDQIGHLYETDHARSLLQNYEKGIGKILIARKNNILEYPAEGSEIWKPNYIWKVNDLMKMIARQVLEFQIYFLNQSPSFKDVGLEKKGLIKDNFSSAKEVNRMYIKMVEDEWE